MRKIKSYYQTIQFIYRAFIINLICISCFRSDAQDYKPVIGVLGLENGGGITESVIDTICNRISYLVECTQGYFVLQRDFIPPVLQEQGFTITSDIYSQVEGLALAGTFLSADQMIGGSISKGSEGINISIQRIQVHNRTLISNCQKIIILSKQEFLEMELPKMVKDVLMGSQINTSVISETQLEENQGLSNGNDDKIKYNADTLKEVKPVIAEKRKSKVPIWIILSGVVVSGAAAGAYLYYEKSQSESPEVTPDLPLGELPIRSR